ncbi:MAG: IMP cyclohydrolase [Anaerolineales bacterium]|nr:IMP cyclohydrolase [Anaerolineales bacterium]
MYVGRIVAVGRTKTGKMALMYRVSSRSFPNRQATIIGGSVAIVPRDGFETDVRKNPYISYNCLRLVNNFAVVANGSQTDPIADKLESGMRMRDALASALFGLDYEHDDYRTPRIAAIVDPRTGTCAMGTIRADALLVKEFKPAAGEAYYLATYAHNYPDDKFSDSAFDAADAGGACEYILGKGVFASMEHPISAVSAMEEGSTFSLAVKDAKK